MAYEFTKAHPELSVTVFDLPAVVEMSQKFHPVHTDNRVSFVGGTFVSLQQAVILSADRGKLIFICVYNLFLLYMKRRLL